MPDRASVALKALRELKELLGRPSSLPDVLSEWSHKQDISPAIEVEELLGFFDPSNPAVGVRQYFHGMLANWDYRPDFEWSQSTKPSSRERRALICKLLGLAEGDAARVEKAFPVYPPIDQPIHITADDPEGPKWYTPERQQESTFYWHAYERYLRDSKGWDPKNIAVLDATSTLVVSDLRDPFEAQVRSTRGLVVGYVQSGKTANFTGVIAKALDAGYRLIIVLAGMQNTLRDQTQRRIDKELVGRELLQITQEYSGDDDWDEFNRHGDIADRLGAFKIDRLTTSEKDFRHPFGDTARLAFHRVDRNQPFNAPSNLSGHPAKMIVIKKNKTPLEHLLNALTQAEAAGTPWSQVPSLIVDDESDQASLDTSKPSTTRRRERTTINKLIVKIMAVLKRSQYVGYTATPFANVFVDPDDADDLFPSDYILPLPRPDGYMGVRDFYDSRDVPKNVNDKSTNYGRYIRPVKGQDDVLTNLPQAIDAFVLSGAVKLFRAAADGKKFKHHTMLVHVSTSVDNHSGLKSQVVSMFESAAYATGGPGYARLKALWEKDYSLVCATHGGDGRAPKSFDDIRLHIGSCVSKIAGNGACAIVLNGTDQDEAPDFDATSVWKIIVGGAKLSRGYTVEGLTISYYRRVAGSSDTLMQMGRWFGYRQGYRDLVRLYIGTEEPRGNSGTIDLYEAFRGVCDDEEEFRAQLGRYSRLQGDQRLTPKQVPPLVPSHLLLPTARNKMYNAKILFVNFEREHKQSTIATSDETLRKSNATAMASLLQSSSIKKGQIEISDGSKNISFPAFAGIASTSDVVAFLKAYRRSKNIKDEGDDPLIREYVQGTHGNPEIDSWAVIAPQFANEAGGTGWAVAGVGEFSIRERARVGEGARRYNVFTESRHVTAAEVIAGFNSSSFKPAGSFTESLAGPRRAVMLFYPVLSPEERDAGEYPTMGFSLLFPKNKIERRIRYGVRLASKPDDVTVPANPGNP
ncbi:MAG: Z1 domain-containing protein [Steroidobacteraceae bacterium]